MDQEEGDTSPVHNELDNENEQGLTSPQLNNGNLYNFHFLLISYNFFLILELADDQNELDNDHEQGVMSHQLNNGNLIILNFC